jgi:hypothetical protein
MGNMVRISVMMKKEMAMRLEREAKEQGLSFSAYVRQILFPQPDPVERPRQRKTKAAH